MDARPAGAIVYDISQAPPPGALDTVTGLSGNDVFLKVGDCARGADLEMDPSGNYKVALAAHARDGKLAAVALCPVRYAPTTVTALRDSRVLGTIRIDVPQQPTFVLGCDGPT
jgi:hypothetical protein